MASSSLANNFVFELFMFRAKHSGVSNPSLCLSYRVVKIIRITFVIVIIYTMKFLRYW